jgi:hypothetical protein
MHIVTGKHKGITIQIYWLFVLIKHTNYFHCLSENTVKSYGLICQKMTSLLPTKFIKQLR